jgi:radical SAM protein with 4Fe4S-binding SPASM domain
MEEMVEWLSRRFPELHGVAFEAVLSPPMFGSIEELDNFYDTFTNHYFGVAERGAALGIEVGNTISNSVGGCKQRSCLSKLTITPEGNITACSRISSPREDFFADFHYGVVTDKEVRMDYGALEHIMGHDVYSHPECGECIAKWHCGGGCLLARKHYSARQMESHCRFIRRMTLETLLKCL